MSIQTIQNIQAFGILVNSLGLLSLAYAVYLLAKRDQK